MFDTLIVQPIFNLLVFIYATIPGHNFGLAIIIFTVIIRLLLWPLVKKQLHQAKAMRELQPELKRIKKAAKGDRQKESMMVMELYKEREINPFGSIGILILQIPIFIGLYSGLSRVVKKPEEIISFSYPPLQDLSWMQQLATNIRQFDETLFGVVDLTRSAVSNTGVYWPALIIVAASAVVQYYQSKQLMPQDKDARSLRTILKDAGQGKQADQSEVSAAVGRFTLYLLPAMIFVFTVYIASGLALYVLVSSAVALLQQTYILRKDVDEIEANLNDTPQTKDIEGRAANAREAEVVSEPETKTQLNTIAPKAKKKQKARKRRKK